MFTFQKQLTSLDRKVDQITWKYLFSKKGLTSLYDFYESW